jgi:hypothetical protein
MPGHYPRSRHLGSVISEGQFSLATRPAIWILGFSEPLFTLSPGLDPHRQAPDVDEAGRGTMVEDIALFIGS